MPCTQEAVDWWHLLPKDVVEAKSLLYDIGTRKRTPQRVNKYRKPHIDQEGLWDGNMLSLGEYSEDVPCTASCFHPGHLLMALLRTGYQERWTFGLTQYGHLYIFSNAFSRKKTCKCFLKISSIFKGLRKPVLQQFTYSLLPPILILTTALTCC